MKKARLTFGRKHFESSLKKPSRDPDFAKRVHGKNQSEWIFGKGCGRYSVSLPWSSDAKSASRRLPEEGSSHYHWQGNKDEMGPRRQPAAGTNFALARLIPACLPPTIVNCNQYPLFTTVGTSLTFWGSYSKPGSPPAFLSLPSSVKRSLCRVMSWRSIYPNPFTDSQQTGIRHAWRKKSKPV